MKKWSVLLAAMAVGVLAVSTRPAFATPAIDGAAGAGEWDGYLLFGTDPDEGFQGQAWDISAFYVYQETGGGGLGNGLYFRMDTYGAPTFLGEPTPTGQSKFVAVLDFNGDSIFDRQVQFNDASDGVVHIKDGSLATLGTGTGSLGSTVEWFAPAALLPSFPTGVTFQARAILDNGGDPAEDFIPDAGFFTPIPEPSSMLLLGLGLLGGIGARRRKLLSA